MDVAGNETPLVKGVSRDLTCTANNIDVATIEWRIVVSGFELKILSGASVNELTIQPLPGQIGMQMYKCVVVSTTGEQYTADAPIEIQGESAQHYRNINYYTSSTSIIELTHTVEVTSSSSSAVPAGGVATLTCEAVSNVPTQLAWTGPSGPVTDGGGVSIITEVVDQTARSILAFHPLLVSHAGQYTCQSSLTEIASVEEASMIISVQGLPQNNSTSMKNHANILVC